MTEMEIIKKLVSWIDRDKFPYQAMNSFIYSWECDYWAMDKGGCTVPIAGRGWCRQMTAIQDLVHRVHSEQYHDRSI